MVQMNNEVRRRSQFPCEPEPANLRVARQKPTGIREVDWLIDLISMLTAPLIWLGILWLAQDGVISGGTLLIIIALATPIATLTIIGFDWLDLASRRIRSDDAQPPARSRTMIGDIWNVANDAGDRPHREPLPNIHAARSHGSRVVPSIQSGR